MRKCIKDLKKNPPQLTFAYLLYLCYWYNFSYCDKKISPFRRYFWKLFKTRKVIWLWAFTYVFPYISPSLVTIRTWRKPQVSPDPLPFEHFSNALWLNIGWCIKPTVQNSYINIKWFFTLHEISFSQYTIFAKSSHIKRCVSKAVFVSGKKWLNYCLRIAQTYSSALTSSFNLTYVVGTIFTKYWNIMEPKNKQVKGFV